MNHLLRGVLAALFCSLLVPTSSFGASHRTRITQAKCTAQHHTRCALKQVHRRPALTRALWVGPLGGSGPERREKLATENRIADRFGLPRFQNLAAIRVAHRDLVSVPDVSEGYYVDEHVLSDRRYVQPWTYHYLSSLAAAFIGETTATSSYPKLKLTSLVRDQDYQVRLKSVAKCKDPESCSTHLTGATFDVSFRNMSKEQFRWLYDRLAQDVRLGKVNAIHEPLSGCFHVFVVPPKTVLALE
jgi:hypothetical protein